MPERNADRIQLYAENPMYWQYRGKPVLLLGGSSEDNLFQVPDVEAELDRLAEAGGNYVRCTMSSRDEDDVWPFAKDEETGLYDLTRPEGEYWQKFQRFLDLTLDRDIILQIEVFDRFDYAREPWLDNPYNPVNNINYTAGESGLAEKYRLHPSKRENGFFRSVPALENNITLLPHQRTFVDKLLSLTLERPNVLYCISNETNESSEWGAYWCGYIRSAAAEKKVGVEVTEMWDVHDILHEMHEATWGHPELYSFCDISQGNHQPASKHWEGMLGFREMIAGSARPRPLNTVKIYGCNSYRYGTTRDAQERFWRNIFAGLAGTRFHRPPAGIGSSDRAMANIRSMRMITDEMDIPACLPRPDLLGNASYNEAYCFANPPRQYGVFFPDGGDVMLDVSAAGGREMTVRWLDILESRWVTSQSFVPEQSTMRLATPTDSGYWAALVTSEM
ncbi:MAG: hypothetical protein ACLFUJ_00905 [Phycisphaerae bacterium]